VLKQPISITRDEIEEFSRLYRNNARPIQPLNRRVVLESK
jgi:carbonic anhydrase